MRAPSWHPAATTIPISPLSRRPSACWRRCSRAGRRTSTEENIQSRIRGVLLMAISNKLGAMVLTTGNKSEMSVGYATLYGDMCGGYSVLKDVYKTTVFALSRWRNAHRPAARSVPAGEVIPRGVDRQAAHGRAAAEPEG